MRERFAGAKEVAAQLRGMAASCGSERRPLAGEGWMLGGDAGRSLVDPLAARNLQCTCTARWAARKYVRRRAEGTAHTGGRNPL